MTVEIDLTAADTVLILQPGDGYRLPLAEEPPSEDTWVGLSNWVARIRQDEGTAPWTIDIDATDQDAGVIYLVFTPVVTADLPWLSHFAVRADDAATGMPITIMNGVVRTKGPDYIEPDPELVP